MLQHPDPFSGAVLDVLTPSFSKMLGGPSSPCGVSRLEFLLVPFSQLLPLPLVLHQSFQLVLIFHLPVQSWPLPVVFHLT